MSAATGISRSPACTRSRPSTASPSTNCCRRRSKAWASPRCRPSWPSTSANFDVRLLPDRQAFDPLPGFLQFSLAELQVLAPAGDRRDRLFQTQLAFLEGVQRRIELRQRLLIGQRFVEAHGTVSSTVASSRPAESITLMG